MGIKPWKSVVVVIVIVITKEKFHELMDNIY